MSITRLPLWERAYDAMMAEGVGYGWNKPASWFETYLHEKPRTTGFCLAMMELKQKLEDETGYYLSTEKDGFLYVIPDAAGHAVVVKRRRLQARRRLRKSISLGKQTLDNPHSDLNPEQKASLEGHVGKAKTELYLVQNADHVIRVLAQFKPKLLPPAPLQR